MPGTGLRSRSLASRPSPGESADLIVDLRIDFAQLLLQGRDQCGRWSRLSRGSIRRPGASRTSAGTRCRHDLPGGGRPARGDGFVAAGRTRLRPGRLHEAGDHLRVDRVGLGPLAQSPREGADLGRVDHHQRNTAPARSRGRLRLQPLVASTAASLNAQTSTDPPETARPSPSRPTANASCPMRTPSSRSFRHRDATPILVHPIPALS